MQLTQQKDFIIEKLKRGMDNYQMTIDRCQDDVNAVKNPKQKEAM